jgi:hypothetical protein
MENQMKHVLIAIGAAMVAIAQFVEPAGPWHELLTNLGAFLAGSQMVRRLGDGPKT